jgi:DNA invertase Pin-like site-specific DNA recombinase
MLRLWPVAVNKAFGYVRLSKYEEGSTSIERQEEAIRALCKARGWRLVEAFSDEDVSGYRNGKRPNLDRMLARLSEVDAVVVYRIDRLARSSVHFRKLLDDFDKAGVEFVTTDMQIDSSTAQGRFARDLVARLAELESDVLSDRGKAVAAYQRSRGLWYGQTPFGFRRDEGGVLEKDPESFAVLEEAARRYLAGESLRSIAPSLGKHHPNLSRALRSEIVQRELPAPMGERLAEQLQLRGRLGTTARPSLLGGIAVCEFCGATLTVAAQSTRNGPRRRGSYVCRTTKHVSIARQWLDEYVVNEVMKAIPTDRLMKRIRKRRKAPALRPAEIELRLERLHHAHFVEEIISRADFLRSKAELEARLDKARHAADDTIEIPLELARTLPDRWPLLTIQEQRRIFRALIERIVVRKATGTGKIDPKRVQIVWR